MELTVLGCSGSYGAPRGGACSGYLLRAGGATLWIDCGNGSLVNHQRHVAPEEVDAIVLTHGHPDHCVDIYGMHVLLRYGLHRERVPVYIPAGLDAQLAPLVGGEWDATFDWRVVADGDTATVAGAHIAFSRTDHPPPTLAVAVAADDRRFVYTSDTGPRWSATAFGAPIDFLLSEATYVHDDIRSPLHLSARQAGEMGRASGAGRLMLTHLWPTVDPVASVAEAAAAFGADVLLAEANTTHRI